MSNVIVIPVKVGYSKCNRSGCTSRGVYSPVLEFEYLEFLVMNLCFTHYREIEHTVVFTDLEDHL